MVRGQRDHPKESGVPLSGLRMARCVAGDDDDGTQEHGRATTRNPEKPAAARSKRGHGAKSEATNMSDENLAKLKEATDTVFEIMGN